MWINSKYIEGNCVCKAHMTRSRIYIIFKNKKISRERKIKSKPSLFGVIFLSMEIALRSTIDIDSLTLRHDALYEIKFQLYFDFTRLELLIIQFNLPAICLIIQPILSPISVAFVGFAVNRDQAKSQFAGCGRREEKFYRFPMLFLIRSVFESSISLRRPHQISSSTILLLFTNSLRLWYRGASPIVTFVTCANWHGSEICDFGGSGFALTRLFFIDFRFRPGADREMFSGLLVRRSTFSQNSIAASFESKLKPITRLWSGGMR